jgi:fatty acid omega-hydroxylase
LQDDVLPDGTQLKAGQNITYLPYAMGRMPFLWGEDALEFKPERWLWRDDEGKLCIRPESPFKFPVFQVFPVFRSIPYQIIVA